MIIYDVRIFHRLILCLTIKAFLLDSGNVEDVRFANEAVQTSCLAEIGTGSTKLILDILGHG